MLFEEKKNKKIEDEFWGYYSSHWVNIIFKVVKLVFKSTFEILNYNRYL